VSRTRAGHGTGGGRAPAPGVGRPGSPTRRRDYAKHATADRARSRTPAHRHGRRHLEPQLRKHGIDNLSGGASPTGGQFSIGTATPTANRGCHGAEHAHDQPTSVVHWQRDFTHNAGDVTRVANSRTTADSSVDLTDFDDRRLRTATDGEGHKTTYGYDSDGNLNEIDPRRRIEEDHLRTRQPRADHERARRGRQGTRPCERGARPQPGRFALSTDARAIQVKIRGSDAQRRLCTTSNVGADFGLATGGQRSCQKRRSPVSRLRTAAHVIAGSSPTTIPYCIASVMSRLLVNGNDQR
jgi:YD repeat-containing protein